MDRREVKTTWDGAGRLLQAQAPANQKAWIEWLDSLEFEESIRIFEDLSRAHPEVSESRLPKEPPVVLFTIWKP